MLAQWVGKLQQLVAFGHLNLVLVYGSSITAWALRAPKKSARLQLGGRGHLVAGHWLEAHGLRPHGRRPLDKDHLRGKMLHDHSTLPPDV